MRSSLSLLASLGLSIGFYAGPALAADCNFQPFSTVPGADVSLHWTVRSGRACTLTLRVDRGIGATDMHIEQQATEGRASTPSVAAISYAPRRGFTGHDRFVVSRTAEAMARFVMRGTAHWTIDVDVVP